MTVPDRREGVRLDKWLWAARLFKTRSLAAEQAAKGRVQVNDAVAKPARELHVGDTVQWRDGALTRRARVLALSLQRGPASQAQAMYAETADSVAARERAAETRRLGVEPALGQPQGRPTKRDRRDLAQWQRWSASIDDA